MRKIWKSAALAVAAVAMTACNQNKFTVEGEIAQAQDSVIYFENIGLEGIQVVDSARLGSDGRFSFREDAPEAPEFYRLRIAGQIINIAIDSTETVTVKADYPTMSSAYEVSGSEECQTIKELTLLQQNLTRQAIAIGQSGLGINAVNDSILKLVDAYKQQVKTDYIFKAPYRSSSYFALFQTLGQYLIFNPQGNRDDSKVFAAVATSWDAYHPGSERGKNLHNIAIEGMKTQRIVDANNSQLVVEADKVQEAGVLDIALQDNHGQLRHLTDLKGQVVLLDFHVFAIDESPARILMLRELYNKYHAQGLEIYQVSLDGDEHFWKQQTAALPWISVRDADGPGSQRLALYNVQAVPDFFIIDRGNNLVKRAANIKDLEAEIRRLL